MNTTQTSGTRLRALQALQYPFSSVSELVIPYASSCIPAPSPPYFSSMDKAEGRRHNSDALEATSCLHDQVYRSGTLPAERVPGHRAS